MTQDQKTEAKTEEAQVKAEPNPKEAKKNEVPLTPKPEAAAEKPEPSAAPKAKRKSDPEARRARDEKRNGEKAEGFGAMLKELTTVDAAVKLYNDMVPTAVDVGLQHVKPVTMFVDLSTGKKACTRLHERISDLVKPSKSTKSKQKEDKTMPKKATKKSKTAAKKSSGPRVKMEDDTKITWAGKANPFREKTGKWERTERVRTNSGQSVKTLRSKKVKTGTIRTLLRMGLVKTS